MVSFWTWFREWKKEHPDMNLAQGRQVYEEALVNNRIQWMGELGWSSEEVRTLPKECASYLGVPEYVENLKANTEFMPLYFDRDEALTLLLAYRVTFSMEPMDFQKYLRDIMEHVGDDWQEALMRQYHEDRDHMIFRNLPVMPLCTQEQWEGELERLYYCSLGMCYIEV